MQPEHGNKQGRRSLESYMAAAVKNLPIEKHTVCITSPCRRHDGLRRLLPDRPCRPCDQGCHLRPTDLHHT